MLPQLSKRWRVIALVRRRDEELSRLGVVQNLATSIVWSTLRRLAGIADAVIHSAPPPPNGTDDPRTRRLIACLRQKKYTTTRSTLVPAAYTAIARVQWCRNASPGGKLGAGETTGQCRAPGNPDSSFRIHQKITASADRTFIHDGSEFHTVQIHLKNAIARAYEQIFILIQVYPD